MNSKERKVRLTGSADLDAVMRIYDEARARMRKSGNMTQWVNGYPSRDVIIKDVAEGNSYVVEKNGRVVGVFTFIVGKDPTYSVIEGRWMNDNPYGTIHRIASADGSSGIADACLEFCKTKNVDIRVDTHADNHPMLGWIVSRGFAYCGIIHVSDGTPRKAFQLLNFSMNWQEKENLR